MVVVEDRLTPAETAELYRRAVSARRILPRGAKLSYNNSMSALPPTTGQPSPACRQPTTAEVLATPVEFVRGVGPQRAALLHRLDVRTAADLIFFFPRDYEDLTDRREIAALDEDHVQTVRGQVVEIDGRSSGFGKSIVGVLVRQGNDYLRAMWFNQPFMREKFREGQFVLFSGKPRMKGGRWEMSHPRVTWLDGVEDQPEMRLLPLYPLTEGLTQYQVRRMVAGAVEQFGHVLEEVFSPELLEQYHLMPLAEALPGDSFAAGCRTIGAGAATVCVPGVVHPAIGGGGAPLAAAGRLSGAAACGDGRHQCSHRAAVSL